MNDDELILRDRSSLRSDELESVEQYERFYGVAFEAFLRCTSTKFAALHTADQDGILQDVRLVSTTNSAILRDIDAMMDIANETRLSDAARSSYVEALIRVGAACWEQMAADVPLGTSLCVAPEREGRYLAGAASISPRFSKMWCPEAKRIPINGGLLFAVTAMTEKPNANGVLIVDGAIASGITVVGLLASLNQYPGPIHILAAHATLEGLRAIVRYASNSKLNVRITVGHATSGLNSHYYAVVPEAPERLIVGDLGDMIFCTNHP